MPGSDKTPEEREPFLAAVQGYAYTAGIAEYSFKTGGPVVRHLMQLVECEGFLFIPFKPHRGLDITVGANQPVQVLESLFFAHSLSLKQKLGAPSF